MWPSNLRQPSPVALSRSGMSYGFGESNLPELHLCKTMQCSNCFRMLPCAAKKRMSSPGDQATFSFQAVAPGDIFKRLSTLNVWPWKAPGINGICHRLLKNCAQALSSSLCQKNNYIQHLVAKGVFPKTWKIALFQPILKNKGERSDARNYRPVALLPSVSKVFE